MWWAVCLLMSRITDYNEIVCATPAHKHKYTYKMHKLELKP